MIGRDHNAKDAIYALESAKRVFGDQGFTFDMIFGRPGNSLEDWQKELKVIIIIEYFHMIFRKVVLIHERAASVVNRRRPYVDISTDIGAWHSVSVVYSVPGRHSSFTLPSLQSI